MAHLYFMSRSDAPGALKVGRSDDPVRRALDLQAGHFFTMKVLARVEGAGGLERSVHALLQDSRVEGPGVEWFRCSLAKALAATARVMDDAAPCEENDPMDDEEVSRGHVPPGTSPGLDCGALRASSAQGCHQGR